jgi:hypothetical protein
MSKFNIFEIGDRNSNYLKSQYDFLKQNYQGDLQDLEAFLELIEKEWTVSINMRLATISYFVKYDIYQNVNEFINEIEKYSDKDQQSNKALNEPQRTEVDKRVIFEQAFEFGENFKYGALNIGGIGVTIYGEFCVIFKQSKVKEYSSLIFIKKDSVKGDYIDNDGYVDFTKLVQDVANKENIHLLATLKHEEDLKQIPDNKWSFMLCCDTDYIEAITHNDINNNHVNIVRMNKKDRYEPFKTILDIRYDKDKTRNMTERDKKAIYNHAELLREVIDFLAQKKIELEVFDE